jgi:manganese-dependent inorganic pyrophosphatase
MIKVFGHKSPDTDSTGSPIIWAWYLSEVLGKPAQPVLLGEPNTEASFVLKRWDLPKPEIITDVAPGEDCVVVDTNNPAELPPSINEANLIQIVDHHMLAGGLKTKQPIDITIRPVGLHRHDHARPDRAGHGSDAREHQMRHAVLHPVGHARIPQPDNNRP